MADEPQVEEVGINLVITDNDQFAATLTRSATALDQFSGAVQRFKPRAKDFAEPMRQIGEAVRAANAAAGTGALRELGKALQGLNTLAPNIAKFAPAIKETLHVARELANDMERIAAATKAINRTVDNRKNFGKGQAPKDASAAEVAQGATNTAKAEGKKQAAIKKTAAVQEQATDAALRDQSEYLAKTKANFRALLSQSVDKSFAGSGGKDIKAIAAAIDSITIESKEAAHQVNSLIEDLEALRATTKKELGLGTILGHLSKSAGTGKSAVELKQVRDLIATVSVAADRGAAAAAARGNSEAQARMKRLSENLTASANFAPRDLEAAKKRLVGASEDLGTTVAASMVKQGKKAAEGFEEGLAQADPSPAVGKVFDKAEEAVKKRGKQLNETIEKTMQQAVAPAAAGNSRKVLSEAEARQQRVMALIRKSKASGEAAATAGGASVGANFGNSMASQVAASEGKNKAAGAKAASGVIEGAEQELGIASPSKAAIKLGNYVQQGLAIGLAKDAGASAAAGRMGRSVMDALANALGTHSESDIAEEDGEDVGGGLRTGLLSMQAVVEAAGGKLGSAAISGLRKALKSGAGAAGIDPSEFAAVAARLVASTLEPLTTPGSGGLNATEGRLKTILAGESPAISSLVERMVANVVQQRYGKALARLGRTQFGFAHEMQAWKLDISTVNDSKARDAAQGLLGSAERQAPPSGTSRQRYYNGMAFGKARIKGAFPRHQNQKWVDAPFHFGTGDLDMGAWLLEKRDINRSDPHQPTVSDIQYVIDEAGNYVYQTDDDGNVRKNRKGEPLRQTVKPKRQPRTRIPNVAHDTLTRRLLARGTELRQGVTAAMLKGLPEIEKQSDRLWQLRANIDEMQAGNERAALEMQGFLSRLNPSGSALFAGAGIYGASPEYKAVSKAINGLGQTKDFEETRRDLEEVQSSYALRHDPSMRAVFDRLDQLAGEASEVKGLTNQQLLRQDLDLLAESQFNFGNEAMLQRLLKLGGPLERQMANPSNDQVRTMAFLERLRTQGTRGMGREQLGPSMGYEQLLGPDYKPSLGPRFGQAYVDAHRKNTESFRRAQESQAYKAMLESGAPAVKGLEELSAADFPRELSTFEGDLFNNVSSWLVDQQIAAGKALDEGARTQIERAVQAVWQGDKGYDALSKRVRDFAEKEGGEFGSRMLLAFTKMEESTYETMQRHFGMGLSGTTDMRSISAADSADERARYQARAQARAAEDFTVSVPFNLPAGLDGKAIGRAHFAPILGRSLVVGKGGSDALISSAAETLSKALFTDEQQRSEFATRLLEAGQKIRESTGEIDLGRLLGQASSIANEIDAVGTQAEMTLRPLNEVPEVLRQELVRVKDGVETSVLSATRAANWSSKGYAVNFGSSGAFVPEGEMFARVPTDLANEHRAYFESSAAWAAEMQNWAKAWEAYDAGGAMQMDPETFRAAAEKMPKVMERMQSELGGLVALEGVREEWIEANRGVIAPLMDLVSRPANEGPAQPLPGKELLARINQRTADINRYGETAANFWAKAGQLERIVGRDLGYSDQARSYVREKVTQKTASDLFRQAQFQKPPLLSAQEQWETYGEMEGGDDRSSLQWKRSQLATIEAMLAANKPSKAGIALVRRRAELGNKLAEKAAEEERLAVEQIRLSEQLSIARGKEERAYAKQVEVAEQVKAASADDREGLRPKLHATSEISAQAALRVEQIERDMVALDKEQRKVAAQRAKIEEKYALSGEKVNATPGLRDYYDLTGRRQAMERAVAQQEGEQRRQRQLEFRALAQKGMGESLRSFNLLMPEGIGAAALAKMADTPNDKTGARTALFDQIRKTTEANVLQFMGSLRLAEERALGEAITRLDAEGAPEGDLAKAGLELQRLIAEGIADIADVSAYISKLAHGDVGDARYEDVLGEMNKAVGVLAHRAEAVFSTIGGGMTTLRSELKAGATAAREKLEEGEVAVRSSLGETAEAVEGINEAVAAGAKKVVSAATAGVMIPPNVLQAAMGGTLRTPMGAGPTGGRAGTAAANPNASVQASFVSLWNKYSALKGTASPAASGKSAAPFDPNDPDVQIMLATGLRQTEQIRDQIRSRLASLYSDPAAAEGVLQPILSMVDTARAAINESTKGATSNADVRKKVTAAVANLRNQAYDPIGRIISARGIEDRSVMDDLRKQRIMTLGENRIATRADVAAKRIAGSGFNEEQRKGLLETLISLQREFGEQAEESFTDAAVSAAEFDERMRIALSDYERVIKLVGSEEAPTDAKINAHALRLLQSPTNSLEKLRLQLDRLGSSEGPLAQAVGESRLESLRPRLDEFEERFRETAARVGTILEDARAAALVAAEAGDVAGQHTILGRASAEAKAELTRRRDAMEAFLRQAKIEARELDKEFEQAYQTAIKLQEVPFEQARITMSIEEDLFKQRDEAFRKQVTLQRAMAMSQDDLDSNPKMARLRSDEMERLNQSIAESLRIIDFQESAFGRMAGAATKDTTAIRELTFAVQDYFKNLAGGGRVQAAFAKSNLRGSAQLAGETLATPFRVASGAVNTVGFLGAGAYGAGRAVYRGIRGEQGFEVTSRAERDRQSIARASAMIVAAYMDAGKQERKAIRNYFGLWQNQLNRSIETGKLDITRFQRGRFLSRVGPQGQGLEGILGDLNKIAGKKKGGAAPLRSELAQAGVGARQYASEIALATGSSQNFLQRLMALPRALFAAINPIKSMGKEAKAADAGVDELADSTTRLDKSAGKLGQKKNLFKKLFGDMGTGVGLGFGMSFANSIVNAIQNATWRLRSAVTQIFSGAVNTVLETEQRKMAISSQIVMEIVGEDGSASFSESWAKATDRATERFLEMQDLARTSSFGRTELLDAYQNLMIGGVDSGNAATMVKAVAMWGDAFRPGNVDTIRTFGEQLSQAVQSGVLQQTDIKPMMFTGGLPIKTWLAQYMPQYKDLGYDEAMGKISEDVGKGLIGTTDAIEAIVTGMVADSSDMIGKAASTITGMFSTLGDLRLQRLEQVTGPLVESGLQPLLEWAIEIGESDTAIAFFDRLGVAIRDKATAAVFGLADAIGHLVGAWQALAPETQQTILRLATFLGLTVAITTAAAALALILPTIGALFTGMLGTIGPLGLAIAALAAAWTINLGGMKDALSGFVSYLGAVFGFTGKGGFTGGEKPAAIAADKGGMFEALLGVRGGRSGDRSGGREPAEGGRRPLVYRPPTQPVPDGLARQAGGLTPEAAATLGTKIRNELGGALEFVGEKWRALSDVVKGVWTEITDNTLSAVETTYTTIGGWVTGSIDAIQGLASSIGQWMGQAWTQAGELTNRGIESILAGLGAVPEFMASLASAMADWGVTIAEVFVTGFSWILEGVAQVLNALGGIFSFWLEPHSPPNIAPSLDTWGTAAADEWLQGWTKADFSIFNELAGKIEAALGENQAKPFREGLARMMRDIIDSGTYNIDDLMASVPNWEMQDEEVRRLADAYGRLMVVQHQMAVEQEKLDDITAQYNAQLVPLKNSLEAIQRVQEGFDLSDQIVEYERVASSAYATAEQKKRARAKLQELKLQERINQVETEREAATDPIENRLASLEAENRAAQRLVDLTNERWQIEQEAAGGGRGGGGEDDAGSGADSAAQDLADKLADAGGGAGRDPQFGQPSLPEITNPIENALSEFQKRINEAAEAVKSKWGEVTGVFSESAKKLDKMRESVKPLVTAFSEGRASGLFRPAGDVFGFFNNLGAAATVAAEGLNDAANALRTFFREFQAGFSIKNVPGLPALTGETPATRGSGKGMQPMGAQGLPGLGEDLNLFQRIANGWNNTGTGQWTGVELEELQRQWNAIDWKKIGADLSILLDGILAQLTPAKIAEYGNTLKGRVVEILTGMKFSSTDVEGFKNNWIERLNGTIFTGTDVSGLAQHIVGGLALAFTVKGLVPLAPLAISLIGLLGSAIAAVPLGSAVLGAAGIGIVGLIAGSITNALAGKDLDFDLDLGGLFPKQQGPKTFEEFWEENTSWDFGGKRNKLAEAMNPIQKAASGIVGAVLDGLSNPALWQTMGTGFGTIGGLIVAGIAKALIAVVENFDEILEFATIFLDAMMGAFYQVLSDLGLFGEPVDWSKARPAAQEAAKARLNTPLDFGEGLPGASAAKLVMANDIIRKDIEEQLRTAFSTAAWSNAIDQNPSLLNESPQAQAAALQKAGEELVAQSLSIMDIYRQLHFTDAEIARAQTAAADEVIKTLYFPGAGAAANQYITPRSMQAMLDAQISKEAKENLSAVDPIWYEWSEKWKRFRDWSTNTLFQDTGALPAGQSLSTSDRLRGPYDGTRTVTPFGDVIIETEGGQNIYIPGAGGIQTEQDSLESKETGMGIAEQIAYALLSATARPAYAADDLPYVGEQIRERAGADTIGHRRQLPVQQYLPMVGIPASPAPEMGVGAAAAPGAEGADQDVVAQAQTQLTQLSMLITTQKALITTLWTDLNMTMAKLSSEAWKTIGATYTAFFETTTEQFTVFRDRWVDELWPELATATVDMANQLTEGALSEFARLNEEAQLAILTLLEFLESDEIAGRAFDAGISIGQAIVDGIVEGMTNDDADSTFQDAGNRVVGMVEGAMRSSAEIHSPSELFKREVGEPIAMGVVAGMTSTKVLGSLTSAASGMVEQAVTAAATAANKATESAPKYLGGSEYGPTSPQVKAAEDAAFAALALEAAGEGLAEELARANGIATRELVLFTIQTIKGIWDSTGLTDEEKKKREEERKERERRNEDWDPGRYWSRDALTSYNSLGQRLDSLGHVAYHGDGELEVLPLDQLDAIRGGGAVGELIGNAVVEGMADAITSNNAVQEAAGTLINQTEEAMREAGEIQSPSRRFAREVGRPIVLGIYRGMNQAGRNAGDVSRRLVDALIMGAQTDNPRFGTLPYNVMTAQGAHEDRLAHEPARQEYHLHLAVTPQQAERTEYNFAIMEAMFGS